MDLWNAYLYRGERYRACVTTPDAGRVSVSATVLLKLGSYCVASSACWAFSASQRRRQTMWNNTAYCASVRLVKE